MRIVQFSDVHVREDFSFLEAPRFGWRRTAALTELKFGGRARDFGDAGGTFRSLVTAMEARRPDHVLFSGDFTALATEREFAEARDILGDWAKDPARFSAVPGNHDRYTEGSVRERRYERYFGHLLQSDLPELQTDSGFPFVRLLRDSAAVVGLDTTRLAPLPGLSFGEIRPAELRCLDRLLRTDALQSRSVMLLMHHAPFGPEGRPDTPTHGLWRLARFLEVVRQHPRLTIHCGHIHRRYDLAACPEHPRILNPGSGTLHSGPGFYVMEIDDDGGILSVDEVKVPIA